MTMKNSTSFLFQADLPVHIMNSLYVAELTEKHTGTAQHFFGLCAEREH